MQLKPWLTASKTVGIAVTPVQFSAQFAADEGFTNVMGMVYYGQESFKEQHDAIFKSRERSLASWT